MPHLLQPTDAGLEQRTFCTLCWWCLKRSEPYSPAPVLLQKRLQDPAVADQLQRAAELWSMLCTSGLIKTIKPLTHDMVAHGFAALLRAACQLPPGRVGLQWLLLSCASSFGDSLHGASQPVLSTLARALGPDTDDVASMPTSVITQL